jgi:DNA-binding SARP family transcriptional activator
MEYRLLGPLEILSGDRSLEISSARQRIVLSLLLLEANRSVSLSRLADAIWDDRPPATARSQVQTCISALRRRLGVVGGSRAILTQSVGYVIRVPDDALDVRNFEGLARRGRAAAAADRPEEAVLELRAALALWRGPAATGVHSRLVQAAATRLNEDRLEALESCIDLELGLGRHHDLIGELSELVQQYPLRERLRAQHMLALYRSARQAEALESFLKARKIFIEEVGLEPGAALTELQRAIFTSDPALALGPQTGRGSERGMHEGHLVPRQLPAAVADLAGREAVLRELIQLLSATEGEARGTGSLPVVSLTGHTGVGKTALALHAAHAVQGCYPGGQLFVQLQQADGQPVRAADVLARFLRALGPPAAAVPEDIVDRTVTYRSYLGNRRVLVILDDAVSVSQIMPLIPGSPICAVIVTSRNYMSALHGARQFQIDDLDEGASLELLASVIGTVRLQAEKTAALALVRLCGCLPLALRIAAAKLHARPHWQISQMVHRMADEGRRLDELALGGVDIRATFWQSYSSLSQKARQLFVRLGMLGAATFAPWVAAPLMDHDPQDAEDLFDTLVEAHLVQIRHHDGGPRFQLHELTRIYAVERLAAEEPMTERTAALERLLGCWLSLAEEAHRRGYGGNYAVLHGDAARWALPAGIVDQLLRRPSAWFRSERAELVSAVLTAAQAGLDELCWDLAVTSVTMLESGYKADEWRKAYESALEVTRRCGNVRGEAAILYSLGNLAARQHPANAARYLYPALRIFTELGDTHGRALTLANIAFVDRLSGRYVQALAKYQQALSGFQHIGDLAGEADALTNLAQIHLNFDRFKVAEELLDRAVTICCSLSAPRILAQTEYRRGEFFLRINDLERAENSFTLVVTVTHHEGDRVSEAYALQALGMVRTRQERYELAEAILTKAHMLSVQLGDNLVHGQVLFAHAELYLAEAQPERAAALLGEILLRFGDTDPDACWQGRLADLKARTDARLARAADPH